MTAFKVCGLTRPEDAAAAVEAGASAVGLIFATSPRRLDRDRARRVAAAVPATVARVGVFADHTAEQIEEMAAACGLRWVQLAGDEPPALAERLRAGGLRVLKVVHVADPGDLAAMAGYPADALLLDAPLRDGRRGGTGTRFDWDAVASALDAVTVPLVVAGGLTPANVGDAIRRLRPAGVDVCSGVEASPGVKDEARLRAFGDAVRAAAGGAGGDPWAR